MEVQNFNNKLSSKILGTWKLVSWTYEDEKGDVIDYFGENPIGVLSYSDSGYMSVQIMKNNRTPFESPGPFDGKPDEIIDAFKTYFAYFGKFVENEAGVLTHTIEGCNFPNWLGVVETRYGEILANQLTLSTPPIRTGDIDTVFKVVWEKHEFY